MTISLALTLPTKHEFVRVTRRALRDYLREADIDVPSADDVVLAVGEACTNAVQHAYPDGSGTFDVKVEVVGDEILAEVVDRGVGFEAFERTLAGGGTRAVAGRGLELIRRLVNEVEVLSPLPSGGTRIKMRRVLKAPVPS